MRLLIVLIIALVLYIVQGIIYKKTWKNNLDVNVYFDESIIREGDKSVLTEEIGNNKALLLPIIQVKFAISRTFLFKKERNASVTDQYYRNEYFSILPYQKITRKYNFIASRRGEYKLSYLDLICKDIFIDKSMYVEYKNFSSILVLPKRIEPMYIPEDVVRVAGDIINNIKLMEDPFEFNSIRDYQPYDTVNHINWKATARLDSLQVNTFHTTNQKNIIIILNLEMNSVRDAENMTEHCIRIAACLTEYFISRNMPVAIRSNGKDYETKEMISMESGSDIGRIRNIEIALARIGTDAPKPFVPYFVDNVDPDNHENEYVIISNYRKDDFMDKYREYREQGVKLSLIIPEYNYIPVDNLSSSKDVKWEVFDEN